MLPSPASDPALVITRDRWRIGAPNAPTLSLQRQVCKGPALADVVYVHGATFGADLSVFHRFDGRSWADALNDAGFNAWGFDFAGYGGSDRHAPDAPAPWGRRNEAAAQLNRVLAEMRRHSRQPLVLLAHSWGTLVASQVAAEAPAQVAALVLFGPIAPRAGAGAPPAPDPQAWHDLTASAQYRRFVSEVPRGEPQVLSEAHFDAWAAAYLSSDPTSHRRQPPSVRTPAGPLADVAALWSGQALVDLRRVRLPTLIVRGAWDTSCDDRDAAMLMRQLGAPLKRDVVIPRATHLMHLESGRQALHATVNQFLHPLLKP